mmetsp:Transcript_44367/g.82861  ORF Transcript_44367/g.82861 Transcript_44367/m.82861 type:complete len:201 (+) Transcript_44367:936-1538(+)
MCILLQMHRRRWLLPAHHVVWLLRDVADLAGRGRRGGRRSRRSLRAADTGAMRSSEEPSSGGRLRQYPADQGATHAPSGEEPGWRRRGRQLDGVVQRGAGAERRGRVARLARLQQRPLLRGTPENNQRSRRIELHPVHTTANHRPHQRRGVRTLLPGGGASATQSRARGGGARVARPPGSGSPSAPGHVSVCARRLCCCQ